MSVRAILNKQVYHLKKLPSSSLCFAMINLQMLGKNRKKKPSSPPVLLTSLLEENIIKQKKTHIYLVVMQIFCGQ